MLTANGEVLTNNHVIDGATSISVTDLGNGRTTAPAWSATTRSTTWPCSSSRAPPASRPPRLGDSADSQGRPARRGHGQRGGKGGTPTSTGGSITALGQSIAPVDELDGTSEHLPGLIQVNADVEAGDSGGSLVDSSGQVIGMDTAAEQRFSLRPPASRGYAIPINQALATARAIEAGQGSADVHIGAAAFLGVLISSGQPGQGQGQGRFQRQGRHRGPRRARRPGGQGRPGRR